MIATVCLHCDEVLKTYDDGKTDVIFSHGFCVDCLPAVKAEVDRQIAEMDQAEGRAA